MLFNVLNNIVFEPPNTLAGKLMGVAHAWKYSKVLMKVILFGQIARCGFFRIL